MNYQTIVSPTQGEYKELGSKFYAFAYPVNSEEEIKKNLSQLRKKYHDARHHCYAFIVGMENQYYRANDDGEPGHSAGDPILSQIRSFELTNTMVVVVRYFGGTKLGVSGLIRAYKTAAKEALSSAKIIEIFPGINISITHNYDATSQVEKLLRMLDINITEKCFTDKCILSAFVKKELFPDIQSKFAEIGISVNEIDGIK